MRTRSRQIMGPMGSRGGGPPEFDSHDLFVSGVETCKDFPEIPGDNQGFEVSRYEYKGGRINRKSIDGSPWARNYTCTWVQQLDSYGRSHLTTNSLPNGSYATTLMARTNPSKPLVDVTNIIGELPKLPSLFYVTGRNFLQRQANDHLRREFGVKPLVDDAMKIFFQFPKAIEARMKTIRDLIDGGSRKTIDLGRFTAQESIWGGNFHSGIPAGIEGYLHKTTTETIRGHVRYAWDGFTPFPESDQAIYALAKQAVLGLRVDITTAWELMPWSWFIDWYSNIGTWLSANRNILPVHVSTLSIMRHTSTRVRSTAHGFWSGSGSFEPIDVVYETKSRELASPSFSAKQAALTDRQLGILTALAFKRLR